MTQREYTLPDGTLSYIIEADKGKKFVRKSDGLEFENIIYLGYVLINGVKTLSVPSDYEEVDDDSDLNSIEELKNLIEDELKE